MRKSFGSIAATATGKPIQGAQVSLYQADHVTPVIIYSDNANPPTQITEGLFTDAKGYWEFYANSGTYSLKQDNPGEDTKWIDGYEIYDDAQQEDGIARSIKVPAGETVATLPAAADRANKYAAFDNAGALIVSDAVGFSQAAGDALTNRVAITENEIGALQSQNGVSYLPYDTWSDYVSATSAYNSGTTYSKGQTLVDQDVMWIYINAVAGAGHAPPALPAVSDAYWKQFRNPLEGQVFQIPVSDSGTHSDPTNGATVPNTGIHVWTTGVSGTGAHYLYPTDAALAKPYADAAAASAVEAASDAADAQDSADAAAASDAATAGKIRAVGLLKADNIGETTDGHEVKFAIRGANQKAVLEIDDQLRVTANRLAVPEGGQVDFGDATANAFTADWDFAIRGKTQQVVFGIKDGVVYPRSGGGGLKGWLPGLSNGGTRLVDTYPGNFSNSVPHTLQMIAESAARFTQVQVIFDNPTTSPLMIDRFAVATRGDMDTGFTNAASGGWTNGTVGGISNPTIPATSGSSRASLVLSDPIDIDSATRTDGRPGGILMARAYISQANAALPIPFLEDVVAAAARTNGYAVSYRHSTGDGVTTSGSFTASSEGGFSPIVGFRYIADGLVVTVLAVGDSTYEGFADTIRSDGPVVRIARHYNDPNGIAWEAAQLGYTGAESNQTYSRLQSWVNAGLRADVMLYAGGTPNFLSQSPSPQTLTASMVTAMRRTRLKAIDLVRPALTRTIVTTWGPFTPNSYNIGASDGLRVTDNEDIENLQARGVISVDLSPVRSSGTFNGSGQELPNTTYLPDGTHESGAGYDAELPLYTAKIDAAAGL